MQHYEIIVAPSLGELEQKVQEKLNIGWLLRGDIMVIPKGFTSNRFHREQTLKHQYAQNIFLED